METAAMQTMQVNVMPAPTWNWLKLNGTPVKGFSVSGEPQVKQEIPDAVHTKESSGVWTDQETGMGKDFAAFAEASDLPVHEILSEAGDRSASPARVYYSLSDGTMSRWDVTCADDSEMVFVQVFRASEGTENGSAAVSTRYHVGKNAKLTIAQIVEMPEDFRFFDDLGGDLEESANIHLVQVVLSGKENFLGHYAGLKGRYSTLDSDLGYQVSGKETLDINYFADHRGRNTACQINASGVLRNEAKKIFRGTIDFKRGAAASTGAEKEDVMLMDDGVINQTIPVILCTEEDVEGVHGATIGRLAQDMMFYMESRGISEEEIYRMMSRARIESAASAIPDETAKKIVTDYLDRMEA